jgi:hypothetical protein
MQVGLKLGKDGTTKGFGSDASAVRNKKNSAVGHDEAQVGSEKNAFAGRNVGHLWGHFRVYLKAQSKPTIFNYPTNFQAQADSSTQLKSERVYAVVAGLR